MESTALAEENLDDIDDGAISAIKQIIGPIAKGDVESLVRQGELGNAQGFGELHGVFLRVQRIAAEVYSLDLSLLDKRTLDENFRSPFVAVANAYNTIKGWSPTATGKAPNLSNPTQDRTNAIGGVKNAYSGICRNVLPIVGYLRTTGQLAPLKADLATATQQIADFKLQAEGLVAKITTAASEAESTLAATRAAATEVGVEKYAESFKEEAKHHQKAGRVWLGATIVLAALAAIGIGIYFFYALGDGTAAPFSFGEVRIMVVRLAAVFVALWLMAWTSRFYRAHCHNAVVNRHRHNALRTFRTFVEGTSDDATKDAIRLQATNAVFTPQPTGYIEHETEQESLVKSLSVVNSAVRAQ